MNLKNIAKKLWMKVLYAILFLADFIFPRGLLEEEIYSLSAGDILEKSFKADEPDEDYLRPILSYRDPYVRNLIWLLKYKENARVASLFGEILNEYIIEDLSEANLFEGFENSLLVPIPMSAKERAKRGWNQAEMLCRELQSISGGFFEVDSGVLLKTRETKSQSSIKRRGERMENIKDCYSVKNGSDLKGRNIILIDDVITTGATMKAARKTLRAAGARNVLCYAVAH